MRSTLKAAGIKGVKCEEWNMGLVDSITKMEACIKVTGYKTEWLALENFITSQIN
jgi:hypothetical protein